MFFHFKFPEDYFQFRLNTFHFVFGLQKGLEFANLIP